MNGLIDNDIDEVNSLWPAQTRSVPCMISDSVDEHDKDALRQLELLALGAQMRSTAAYPVLLPVALLPGDGKY